MTLSHFFFISQQSLFLTFCMVMVLVMNVYCIAKEVVQISQQVLLTSVITTHKACAHKSGLCDTSSQYMNMFRLRFSGSLRRYHHKVTFRFYYSIIAIRITSASHYMFSNMPVKCISCIMHWWLRIWTFVCEILSHIYKVVCLSAYFVFQLFLCFFHVKALELLQGLFQPVWLDLSYLLSPVHHPGHVQCRGFFTLASRGNCSFKLLDWISPLSPEVLIDLLYISHFGLITF